MGSRPVVGLVAATGALSVPALLVGLVVRRAVLVPGEGAICIPMANFGFLSLLGFPEGWVLVPLAGGLIAALLGYWVAQRPDPTERTPPRWWVYPAVTFIALYVPFGPMRVGLLPMDCLLPA